jgi:hypothetical protein
MPEDLETDRDQGDHHDDGDDGQQVLIDTGDL